MWFIFKRRKKRAAKKKEQAATTRRKPKGVVRQRAERRKIPAAVLRAGALVLGILAVFAAAWGYRHFYLYRSDRFTLRHVDVADGHILSRDWWLTVTGLAEGSNIFTVCNIQKRQRDILAGTPLVKELSIQRELPDRMVVKFTEREPVARVRNVRDAFLVDAEGVVFSGGWAVPLPVITGFEGAESVKLGDRLEGAAFAAAVFAAVYQTMDLNFKVAEINARSGHRLELTFAGTLQMAGFTWEGMQRKDGGSAGNLRNQLAILSDNVLLAPSANRYDVLGDKIIVK